MRYCGTLPAYTAYHPAICFAVIIPHAVYHYLFAFTVYPPAHPSSARFLPNLRARAALPRPAFIACPAQPCAPFYAGGCVVERMAAAARTCPTPTPTRSHFAALVDFPNTPYAAAFNWLPRLTFPHRRMKRRWRRLATRRVAVTLWRWLVGLAADCCSFSLFHCFSSPNTFSGSFSLVLLYYHHPCCHYALYPQRPVPCIYPTPPNNAAATAAAARPDTTARGSAFSFTILLVAAIPILPAHARVLPYYTYLPPFFGGIIPITAPRCHPHFGSLTLVCVWRLAFAWRDAAGMAGMVAFWA